MNGDYSALAQAFQRQKMGGQRNGGIVQPHMQQPRPMGQMPGGVPGPGGIMDGQPRPQFGQFAGNIPRPMGGGIMGGQPQRPTPMQQFGSLPRPQQAPGNVARPGAVGMNYGRQPGQF